MTEKDIVKISRALSDPTRLRIYESISSCDHMFCGQIVEKYNLTPGTISHHLKILIDAGLIESRREGQFIFSRALPERLRQYSQWMAGMADKKKSRRKSPAA